MPADPKLIEQTGRWLRLARADLRMAALALEAKPPEVGGALFHCQQAAEKAAKALVCWRDEPFEKTHDLEELGRQCAALDESLGPLMRRVIRLTDYAVDYRYPSDLTEPTASDRSRNAERDRPADAQA